MKPLGGVSAALTERRDNLAWKANKGQLGNKDLAFCLFFFRSDIVEKAFLA